MVLPSIATLVAIVVIFGALFGVLRRPWTAGGLTAYTLGFVLLNSFVKQAYLGLAMTLADMRFFALRPAENFTLFFRYPLLGLTLVGVFAGAALCVALGLRLERPVGALLRARTGGALRIAIVAGAASVGVAASLLSGEESHARVDDGDAFVAFKIMYEQQHPQGPIGRLNLFFNNRSFDARLPQRREQSRFVASGVGGDAASVVLPDIALVLQESTFDPTLIRQCPRAACDVRMLHPAQSATRTQQGPLLVHTTGGGTWLAEFSVMSGLDWRIFGRGGAYAPVSLAPRLRESLPKRMRAIGYRTVALYPTDGNFLSGQSAYGYYGFEEFYDAKDLALPEDWQDVNDALILNKALQIAQRHDDGRPLFIFMLTVRNHGPHGGNLASLAESGREVADKTNEALADYLARMRASSRDYAVFSARWLASSRPRVVAWFGDHQPEAAWDFTEDVKLLDAVRLPDNLHGGQFRGDQYKFLTQYQFSANFGEREQRVARDALDISYLYAELSAFAGLPLDGGALAARTVRNACNGLMLDCADRALIDDYLSYRIYDLRSVE